jgi:hypothetical protein
MLSSRSYGKNIEKTITGILLQNPSDTAPKGDPDFDLQ